MGRIVLLEVLIACGALSYGVSGYQQPPPGSPTGGPPPPQDLVVDKLKDNLFVLRGFGANTVVFITTDGVTIVDTKLPGGGQSILAKVKGLTAKPVVRLVNTHTHLDHVGGNVEFSTTVDIVAHENTAANMKKMPPATGLGRPGARPPNIFEQNNGRGLPKRTFRDKLTIGNGPDQIDLYYFGRGHTNGDAWIVFPALRVVHAGDMFRTKEVPVIDVTAGGSVTEMPESLDRAYAALHGLADTVVTGHARQLMTMSDLREYTDFNRDFVAGVEAQKKAGKSADEVVKTWAAPAKYANYFVLPDVLQADVLSIYKETR